MNAVARAGEQRTEVSMQPLVLDLVRGLRAEDIAVGVDRVTQALGALRAVRPHDRETVRRVLAATLLTSFRQRDVFDRLFDAVFDASRPVGPSPSSTLKGPVAVPGAEPDGRPATSAAAPGERPSEARATRDPTGAPRRDRATVRGPAGSAAGAGAGGGRAAADVDPSVCGSGGVELLALDADLDQEALVSSVRRMAGLSQARPGGRARASRRVRVDLRGTIRRSLATGGALVEPAFQARRRQRPRLVMLADASGSMGPAARLGLLVCHAFSRQFSSVRSFAFVDTAVEVTGLLERAPAATAIAEIGAELHRWGAATSDYGTALASLWPDHAGALTARTAVIVLGDARTNYRPARADLLAEIRERVARVVWLNPEPRAYWGHGDSATDDYAPHCDAVYECRRTDQLVDVVSQLASERKIP